MRRHALTLLLILSTAATASAQTLRWQTSVGSFDMVLNPTNSPLLQNHVDNMLANVTAGLYHDTVINRAQSGFVMQLGGFSFDSRSVDDIPLEGFTPVESFDPIVGTGISGTAFSNVRGTVALALSGGNPNSGSSSFFINQGDNSFLNNQGFVAFAQISDMTVVDAILDGDQIDLSNDVFLTDDNGNFITDNDGNLVNGGLTYSDVPVTSDGQLILIESVAIIDDGGVPFSRGLRTALNITTPPSTPAITETAVDPVGDTGSGLAGLTPEEIEAMFPPIPAAAVSAGSGASASLGAAVPEPTAGLLLLLGLGVRRRR